MKLTSGAIFQLLATARAYNASIGRGLISNTEARIFRRCSYNTLCTSVLTYFEYLTPCRMQLVMSSDDIDSRSRLTPIDCQDVICNQLPFLAKKLYKLADFYQRKSGNKILHI